MPVPENQAVEFEREREKDENVLLTADEAAALLNVSPNWVRSHATRTRPIIPSIKLGKGKSAPRRFRLSAIKEFLEKRPSKS